MGIVQLGVTSNCTVYGCHVSGRRGWNGYLCMSFRVICHNEGDEAGGYRTESRIIIFIHPQRWK